MATDKFGELWRGETFEDLAELVREYEAGGYRPDASRRTRADRVRPASVRPGPARPGPVRPGPGAGSVTGGRRQRRAGQRSTAISPSSDQPDWSIDWLMIFGVATRYCGNSC
ncbi:hypothetical protein Ait01nite_055210 [Actinoplanes italicus]|nr:hypothetical protein Ait01nite_055210 [Actinoplanes italicus]